MNDMAGRETPGKNWYVITHWNEVSDHEVKDSLVDLSAASAF